MHDIDIIALLLTIIAIFIAIWFLRKVLILIAILIVVAVIGYLYLQNNQDLTTGSSPAGASHSENIEMLDKFKDNYCGMLYDRDDSLMCSDIVEPIYQDIVKNYNLDSVSALSKKQMFRFLVQVASKNKGKILRNLKRDNALYLWTDFVQDLKHFYSF